MEVWEFMGGIWDLFKYFGLCFDFDMYILGFFFYLWKNFKVIVDGFFILFYIKEIVVYFGIDKKI